jgi:hypothetical protein
LLYWYKSTKTDAADEQGYEEDSGDAGCVGICTFVPVKQVKCVRAADEEEDSGEASVGICTFVPVKRVKCVRAADEEGYEEDSGEANYEGGEERVVGDRYTTEFT